jgi:L-alanine-DL-glutamate epimerase-like enolase superfamily enzyme
MRIANVEATWLQVPIPPERQHVSDFGRVDTFDTVLVRIKTECGIVGHGEAKAGVGSSAPATGLPRSSIASWRRS